MKVPRTLYVVVSDTAKPSGLMGTEWLMARLSKESADRKAERLNADASHGATDWRVVPFDQRRQP